MAENLENVGYALPGRFCRYNIDNMEETTSILALGAGGISKCVMREEEKILRAPNIANIEQYIGRVDEMIERLEYDILYYENMSLILDITILIYTVKTVFTGKGI